ncbi:DNA repair protein RadA [Actinocatenispora thailandica]|uniref:DNA repair protein RadA n=1 Tax=Actinocatenispora thailandica TaxID=227318 RepID=UPI00194E245C
MTSRSSGTRQGSASRGPAVRTVRPAYHCDACGFAVPKWVGRCPDCGSWGSIVEAAPAAAAPAAAPALAARAPSVPASPIGAVDLEEAAHRPTGVGELDRVLGGGLVPGSVVLLAGEPGVGKSTLLLEVAYRWCASAPRPVAASPSLVVSGEESAAQVRLRAERTGAVHDSLFLATETDLANVLGHIDTVKPGLLILDSVQTIASPEVDGSAGGVTQVRAVTAALVAVAKERGIATVLVGHVTKDGAIAGPRVLEHLVDVVLHFEGDRHSTLRLVRAVKNRFGAADEVGCFEMHDGGIRGLADPSGLFLSRHADPVPGTCVTVTVEGRRPLLTEVQALVAPSVLPSPRRAVSGLDSARVAMALAVLERRCKVRLHDREVFAATVGGVRVNEPSADLAVSLAVASASRDFPLPADLVAIGEVGLAGEVRPVSAVPRRLSEAARLGFTRALVPVGCGPAATGVDAPAGLSVTEVPDLGAALRAVADAARGSRD